MIDVESTRKLVLVHVGPHKTGSTAIQKWLNDNKPFLASRNAAFLHCAETHKVARQLSAENYDAAEQNLQEISSRISKLDAATVILSQEDFSGELPGRSKKRGIYPKFTKNLRVINRALAHHRVEFLFIERSPLEWLKSAYHQHLVYRTNFHEFDTFSEFLGGEPNWDKILQRANAAVKGSLHRAIYSKNPESGVRALLSSVGIPDTNLPSNPGTLNQSPSPGCLRALERINAVSAYPRTAWFTKKLIVDQWVSETRSSAAIDSQRDIVDTARYALPDLLERASRRIPTQQAEDLLPAEDMDLGALLTRRLPSNVDCPAVSRLSMSDQSRLLDYHFRGKSELSKLNALTISYLRRNTPHTKKARTLFLRIWVEYGIFLVNELSSRWLISTLQTFLDHGTSEAQRLVGGCGYFYANMIKIYEGERAIEGLGQDKILSGTEPITPNKFRGLDRYKVGGTDLLLNTNALALEISRMDSASGLVLQEFLLRVKTSGNVFTRSDATRSAHKIEIADFEDTWSFFVEPDRNIDDDN